MLEDEAFEDSFTQDMGDFSASNKKHGYCDDDSISYNQPLNSKIGKFDENSPPPTELVKARSNLIKQFDSDSFL
jgi:hypothetical protein